MRQANAEVEDAKILSAGNEIDTGLAALLMVAELMGVAADMRKLRHEFGSERLDSTQLALAAKSLGLRAKWKSKRIAQIRQTPLPAVGRTKAGEHFVLARVSEDGSTADKALIQVPGSAPRLLSFDELNELWTGDLLLLTSKNSYIGEFSQFDFSWFVPAVVKYRRLLLEVLLVSFVIQLLGLATPLLFQVVMDKVLVNHAYQTLNVIAIAMLAVILFESVLTWIRSFVFSQTTGKIDVELGARLFKHMLSLPLAYFQARRVGDTVARVHELESIRSFLTGNAITLVLDVLFSFVYIGVMLWYSKTLTLIVLASLPAYVVLSILLTPIIRSRLNTKFNRGADNQAFLVETVTGIDTLKSTAIEPRWQRTWETQLAGYVKAGLSANNIGFLANGGVSLVSKITSLLIIWIGASQVIEGALTVGQLVAFNMLASQVSNPIIRMAQMWNDFQQVGISIKRLGDILNCRGEVKERSARMPRIEGNIELDAVSFRYRPDAPDVLRNIRIKVCKGEVIGVVGRSGSGKSTLTRLIQKIYIPDRGRVLIDGHDIGILDASSIRSQIGVVLQDNMLFNKSIRDNICVAVPSASMEEVVEAAKLANAHEFICEMPEGYDTIVGEHGVGLSGGQRQRIAIARALITDPRILIFDEATSALDYESERLIQNSMKKIAVDRTVIIVAHRLSAVRDANRILVMERGQVVESGPHSELMNIDGGIYRRLVSMQANET